MRHLRRGLLALTLLLAACGDAPQSEWQAVDGRSGSMAELQGRWVLVNWWAVWCAPCRKEIPEFNAVDAGTDDADLLVLGVNFDNPDAPAMADAVAALDVAFPVTVPGAVAPWGLQPPEVLPSTLLIDPDGAVVAELVGPQTGEQLHAALVAAGAPLPQGPHAGSE